MNRGILRPIGLIGIGLIALCFTLLTESPTSAVVLFQSPLPGEPSAYNFEVDVDNDGIPDELAAALAELDDLAANARSDAAAEALYENALRQFGQRLPFSPQTRAKQAKISAAYQRILNAPNQRVIDSALQEIRDLLPMSIRN